MSSRLYYRIKPLLPRAVRMALRRHHARRILTRSGDVWPILERAGREPANWPGWPDGKEFAFVLTHDVESEAGLRQVRKLAELEMEMGFRSSFNFIPEGEYKVSKELREWLVDNGFEVGVHDLHHDGHLYSSRKAFRKHADRINHYLEEWGAVGFRSGFMLRRLDWLHDLNILYDASTFDTDPFEPQPGGAETIFPFTISDGNERRYVELPYTLPQDSSLFLVLGNSSPDIWTRKLAWIQAKGGMALLNVHPDYIDFDGTQGKTCYGADIYRQFLSRLRADCDGHCHFALPRSIARWYLDSVFCVSEPSAKDVRETTETGSSSQGLLSLPCRVEPKVQSLVGKRVGVVLLSDYRNDPRPRRAAEALARLGARVDIVSIQGHASQSLRETINGVSVLRVPMRRNRGGVLTYAVHYFGFLAVAALVLCKRSFGQNYDIVHVHNMPDFLVFSAVVPKLLGAKVILDLHDPMPELMRTIFGVREESFGVRCFKWAERVSFAYADALITVNHTCKKIFAGRSCSADKISVIMNSPDEEIFQLRSPNARPTDRERFIIMYHGSLVERNGLGLAVEAMATVSALVPSAELRIYGAPTPFLESVLEDARRRNLGHCVKFEGARKIEEIVGEIDRSDVGIIPNLRSIFTEINTPTRIFEFLFRGKPVIAPFAPGVLEYFSQHDLVCFELGSAASLAEQICFVFNHPNQIQEITKRGQEVCKRHRWSEEQQQFAGLVERLLGGINSASSPTIGEPLELSHGRSMANYDGITASVRESV
ncbi:MAG: glycosyltransferase [Verrucomicrobiae bacterium]|nr:glycosyltransferase [Verrucomicrobiae bacterium]